MPSKRLEADNGLVELKVWPERIEKTILKPHTEDERVALIKAIRVMQIEILRRS